MLKAHKGINQAQPLRVFFNYFNASSIDFNIYAFTNTTSKDEYQKIKQEILLTVADIIESHKAEIAFPTQTLHIQNSSES
jgi:MscS family membrane protein